MRTCSSLSSVSLLHPFFHLVFPSWRLSLFPSVFPAFFFLNPLSLCFTLSFPPFHSFPSPFHSLNFLKPHFPASPDLCSWICGPEKGCCWWADELCFDPWCVCVPACVCLLCKCVYEVVRMQLHSMSCVLLFMSLNFLSEAALYYISLITEPYLPNMISWAFLTLLYTHSWLLAYLGSKAFLRPFALQCCLKSFKRCLGH